MTEEAVMAAYETFQLKYPEGEISKEAFLKTMKVSNIVLQVRPPVLFLESRLDLFIIWPKLDICTLSW